MPRIRRMAYVDRPLVAVLRDNAGHDFVKRVATLAAAGLKVRSTAGDHGSGLGYVGVSVTLPVGDVYMPLRPVEKLVHSVND
jgi:hypothetical protein